MSIVSGSFQISSPYVIYITGSGIPAPIADVITKSTTGRTCVLEACVQTSSSAATSSQGSSFAISRSTNTPVQAGQTYLTPENQSDPTSLTSVATAWSVAPLVGTTIRRFNWVASFSAHGALFTFARGYNISPTNSIVLSYAGSVGAFNSWQSGIAINGYFVVNE